MSTLNVPELLDGILEATAAEAAAKARIATYRAALEDEARRRYAADGAAPSWNAPQLGKVRLEPEGNLAAVVADPLAFGDHVLEHYPTEAVLVLEVTGTDAQAATEALSFAGVTATARVEPRLSWAGPYLDSLDVERTKADEQVAAVDPNGLVVPGIAATRSPARLVVSLDRARRTAAVDEARTAAEAAVIDATGDGQAAANLAALDVTRRELEALHGDQLATIAKAHGLGSSGTKAALAERIARAEHATGKVVRPASHLPGVVGLVEDQLAPVGIVASTATPEPLPDDAEVEEVTTLPAPAPLPNGAPLPDLVDALVNTGHGTRDEVVAGLDRALTEPVIVDPPTDTSVYTSSKLNGLSREALRRYAKSRSISGAGTKDDVVRRLVDARVTVSHVNAYLDTHQERTA